MATNWGNPSLVTGSGFHWPSRKPNPRLPQFQSSPTMGREEGKMEDGAFSGMMYREIHEWADEKSGHNTGSIKTAVMKLTKTIL